MHERIVAFIAALRAAGLRVSVAEGLDAMAAAVQTAAAGRAPFRAALQTTLVKAHPDQAIFARLFPLYFESASAILIQPAGHLAEPLTRALAALGTTGDLGTAPSPLEQIFAATVDGQLLPTEPLLAALSLPSSDGLAHPNMQRWVARQALQTLGLAQLETMLDRLLAQLRATGMAEAELMDLAERVRTNQGLLIAQLEEALVAHLQRQVRPWRPRVRHPDDLIDQPFQALYGADAAELHAVVARLAAQLRTRVSLRQRRDRRGTINLRSTLRASLTTSGVPFQIRRRRRRLRPRLVIFCDVSSSMRPVAGLMLALTAALHDQVRDTRAFAYVDVLHDIGAELRDARPEQAIGAVLAQVGAAYARTDLGSCLEEFVRYELGALDRRTTVIILGDGRNNGSDPGLAALQLLRSRARALIWLTPEQERSWGSGDSAMLEYAPLCDAVRVVATLRQLGDAVAQALLR